eukprot:8283236-Alexandrium_andersonii.AAC.1
MVTCPSKAVTSFSPFQTSFQTRGSSMSLMWQMPHHDSIGAPLRPAPFRLLDGITIQHKPKDRAFRVQN